jgi:uncharacterized protein
MIMSKNNRLSRLRFNFGFLLEADLGTSRRIEFAYPSVQLPEGLTLSPLSGEFTVTRTSEGVYLDGRLESAIQQQCVRCLEEMRLPITVHLEELFYYPTSAAPEGEQLVFDGESGFIDLGPLVRELSLLEVPIQPTCRPDCQGLCMECGQNLNETDCGCEVDEIDPRLAGLRALLE